jgi:hypothetical protein
MVGEKIIKKKTEQAMKFAKRFEWGGFMEKALCELKSSKVKSL